MNRSPYFNYIEEKLNLLAVRIEKRGKLNILDLHLHSENFYLHFFNKLFGWSLENLNAIQQNVEAIDLIDHTKKFIFQVSSTNTKAKIESALDKDILKQYPGYGFKFISISKDATDLRTKTYNNPHNLTFSPSSDIFDTSSLLNYILSLDAVKQKDIYQFIQQELGNEVDIVKLDSNLAAIINILSKEDWNDLSQLNQINSFEIERKVSFNNLVRAKYIIDDYKIHYGRIDSKYSEFDSFGKNKSNAVLSSIRKEYIQQKGVISDDDLFFAVIDKVIQKIQQSANYVEIPIDELELSVNVLVVDAFIRCKIFENPENYNYATP
ncbi:ABC-three component system protein [Mucilaginibacter sp. 10I4]|uniref:ABC-three component system protein n=1 Tax=Mucilaginibacter sp. 10I4 TaxID=3048580 RepID=UPI002B238DF0|nr:ABC-three component system protein [Mucilaginibacter sp. 10I4]MEB0261778.1 SMEK domain-containing protein [Mucilaginibacter sp. 10I4]